MIIGQLILILNLERRFLVLEKENNPDKFEEKWTGDYVFENEWQSFRTKDNRKLDLVRC